MARCSTVVCATISAVLMCGASASAQTSATDQYLPTAGATVTTGVAGETAGGSEGTGTSGTATTGATAGTGGGGGSGPGAGSGAAVTAAATYSVRLTFGSEAPAALVDAIEAALAQAGLGAGSQAVIPRTTVEEFLDSDLATSLGGGPEAIGRAVAGLLLAPSGQTAAVVSALGLDPDVVADTPTHAIFTRTSTATGDLAAFESGIVKGFDGVPRAYVELADASKSFVEAFKKLGVPTVDNLDTPAGKAAFVAILVSGATGSFGTKDTADSKLTALGVEPLAAELAQPDDGSIGAAMPYVLLLALVSGALLRALPGLRKPPLRQRRR